MLPSELLHFNIWWMFLHETKFDPVNPELALWTGPKLWAKSEKWGAYTAADASAGVSNEFIQWKSKSVISMRDAHHTYIIHRITCEVRSVRYIDCIDFNQLEHESNCSWYLLIHKMLSGDQTWQWRTALLRAPSSKPMEQMLKGSQPAIHENGWDGRSHP